MSAYVPDLRQSFRHLARRPAFVVLVVATLGLGIGAATAIFSVVDAVILRPLPFPEPDRLVSIFETTPQGRDFAVSEANFLDFARSQRTFESLAAFSQDELALVPDEGEPIRLHAARVSASFFDVLGTPMAIGRAPSAAEDLPGGAQSVVVLSDDLWQRTFGGDPGVIGTTISLSDRPHTVVGVLTSTVELPDDADVWVPLRAASETPRGHHDLTVLGRLASTFEIEQAHEDLALIANGLATAHPDTNEGWSVRLQPLYNSLISPDLRRRMAVILGAVGLLLLIACVNVSNLILAQGLERRNELAVRAALGASRRRLVRQLVTESVGLGLAGGGLGLLLASWIIPLVNRLDPGSIARLESATLDLRVFAFAIGLALAAGVVFGLIPASQVVMGKLNHGLTHGSRRIASGSRLRDGLVVAELALAMTLLLGATLLGKSFVQLLSTDIGIETERVIAAQLTLAPSRYEADERIQFFTQLEASLRAMPEVEHVSASNILPISGSSTAMGVAVEGRAPGDANERPTAHWRAVRPGIFETLGVPVLRGRGLRSQDVGSAEAVTVISRQLANRLFPDTDPIGQRLQLWEDPDQTHTVVGVVADVNDTNLDGTVRQTVYFPDSGDWPWMTLLVRTQAEAPRLATLIREAVWRLDPSLPIPAIEGLDTRKAAAAAPQRFTTAMIATFSTVAALLAAIGVYGLLSYLVTGSAREISIRMALGARQGSVLRLVLGRAFRLAIAGVVLGIGAALALGRTVESLLFETAATDPRMYFGVSLALIAIALVASYLPARRASRLSPTMVLNGDG